jgi:uncharacterized cofD-like protein
MAPESRGFESWSELARWSSDVLRPGIGLKRWIAAAALGSLLLWLGVSFALSAGVTSTLRDIGWAITLGGVLPPLARGIVFALPGGTLVLFALFMLYRRLVLGSQYAQGRASVIQNLTLLRTRQRGPRVVVIGGGTGQATALRGLKQFTDHTTAIVTVADDGGSSGRLRKELGIPPPGDARQCLIALSDAEALLERAFNYRFNSPGELDGHSLGNLMIAALTGSEGGFTEGLRATGRLLAVHGQVIPSTLATDVHVTARLADGRVLRGESMIGMAGGPFSEIGLEPSDAPVNPAALEALQQANIIVIGPGSLYTSILPNFMVPGFSAAVQASSAPKVFICNIATQHGETDGMNASDHLNVFERHSEINVSHFLQNRRIQPIDAQYHQDPLEPTNEHLSQTVQVIQRDLIDDAMLARHAPRKLAEAIIELAR